MKDTKKMITNKQGWEMKKLGEVCETGAGGTPLKTHKDYYEGGTIPWLLSGEVSQGEIFEAKNFITEKGLKNSSAKLFPPNTVLVAMYGATAGQVGILRFEAATNQAVCGILPNNKTIPEYLFYCFLSKKDELVAQAVGGAQPNISQVKIKNTKIPLPPLPEQRRIVAILDEAFTAVAKAKANAEQNLKNAKALFESYLQGVFERKGDGWEERKLGDTCVVERGSSPRPIDKYQTDSPDGVNWIKIGDTKGIDKYIYTTKEKITKEGAEKSRYVKDGDFILSNSMSFGKPYIMKTDGYIHDGWFVFRLPDYLDKDFFYYLLTSPNVQKQIQSLGAGAIVKNISGDLVKKVDLFFPKSRTEQQSIVRQLDTLRAQTQKLEAVYRKKLEDLEELKKSILQKAFAGELGGGEPVELKTEKAVTV